MTKRVHSWIGLAALTAALLGGAYLIVAQNSPALSTAGTAGATASAAIFH